MKFNLKFLRKDRTVAGYNCHSNLPRPSLSCTMQHPYWSRPADTAPEMPPKAPERTRPPAPHLLNVSGAERSAPNRRRKSVTFRRRRLLICSFFRRRPGDFPAPGTTCLCGLIVFRRRPGDLPAPTSFIMSAHICVLGNAPSPM